MPTAKAYMARRHKHMVNPTTARGSVQFASVPSDHWIRLTWCAHGIKSNQIKLYGEQGAQTMHQ